MKKAEACASAFVPDRRCYSTRSIRLRTARLSSCGAGEWTLFWHITMRLSTPILSVIALQAFSVAYANFMYALLICQDPKMWTLMVWLYQLQQRSGPGLVQASLLLAALPTLAVFLACQRVLLRGIVVPVEK